MQVKNVHEESIKNGTYHMQQTEYKELFSQIQLEKVAEGIHHFLGGSNPMHKLVADGTHPWLGNGELQYRYAIDRLERGIIPFGGRESIDARVEDGTYSRNSKKVTERRLKDGTHHFLGSVNPNKEQAMCPHCNKIGGKQSLKRWHFDNCELLTGIKRTQNLKQITCPHCSKTGGTSNMNRYHFDNCKLKK